MARQLVGFPPRFPGEKLLVAIDFGTAYNAVAYSLGPVTRTDSLHGLPPSTIRVVNFNNQTQVKCQLAWWHERGQWAWGIRLDDLVESGKILDSGRILMFKLGLDQSDETRKPRDRVRDQLQDIPLCAWDELRGTNADDFEKLIIIYLKRFWADAKKRISEDDYLFRSEPLQW